MMLSIGGHLTNLSLVTVYLEQSNESFTVTMVNIISAILVGNIAHGARLQS